MHQESISLKCQQSGLSDGNNSLSFAGLTKKRPRSASSATGLSRTLNISPKYLRTKAHKKTSPHSQQSYHTSPYPLPPKKVFCSLERQQFLRSQAEDNSCLQNKISKPLTLLEECDTQPQSYTATATTFSSPVSVSHDGDGHFNTDSFSYTAHESRTFMHSREHNSIDIHLEQQQLITPGDNSYLAQTQSLNEKADSNKCLDECKNSGSEKEAEIKCDESDCWIVPSPETYCDVSPDVMNRTESDTKSSPASDESLFQNQYSYSDWNLESTVRKKKTSSLSSGSYLSSVSSPPSPHSSDAESAANINHTKPNRLLLLDAIQSSIFRQKYFPVPDKKICLESSLLSKVLPQLKEKDLDNSQEYGLQALLKGNTSEEKISSQNTAHSVEDESSVICEKETEQKSDKVSKDLNAECKSTSNEVKVKKECFLSSSLLTDGKCQVCGDVAAGFYCGAFICEACKKFFVRTCKQGKVKYICHRNKKCIITKENRIRCQYCRYQKCLSVNMYSPADQPAGTKSDINNIPCRVCGGPSSGFHFGALTCEGCKGFFRRMAKERQPNTYRCPKEGSCSINTFTRNICKACRYKKCTDVGMCLEGSRIGRQPNSIKHALSLEAKKIKPESDISVTQNCEVKPVLVKKYTESENKETEEIPVDVQQADVKQEPIFFPDDIKTSLKDAMKTFSDLRMDKFTSDISKLSTMEGAWEEMMNHLEISAKCTIMFAKHVPGFKTLLMSDQIVLMQLATYPISLLNFARHYDLDKGDNACLGFSRAQEKMLIKFFPSLDILPAHHRHVGFMMKHLCIDDQELAIMCAVILFCDDCEILKENWKVKKWHDYFVECLQQHIQMSYRDSNTRFGALLLRLGELAVNSLQQNKTIMSIITSHPHLQVNRLFKEIFAV